MLVWTRRGQTVPPIRMFDAKNMMETRNKYRCPGAGDWHYGSPYDRQHRCRFHQRTPYAVFNAKVPRRERLRSQSNSQSNSQSRNE